MYEDEELIASSFTVAKVLGTSHHSVMSLIRKYKANFDRLDELELHPVLLNTKGGPQFTTICYLNRDHISLLVMLSKNTEKSLPIKMALIKDISAVFAAAREDGIDDGIDVQSVFSL